MQDRDRLERALRAAHNAGDTQAATRLAQALRDSPAQVPDEPAVPMDGGTPYQPRITQAERDFVTLRDDLDPISSAGQNWSRGFLESLNLSDEAMGLSAHVANARFGSGLNPRRVAEAERERLQTARDEGGWRQMGREVVSNAPFMLASTGAQGLRGAVAGGFTLGGVAGAGDGETVEERAQNAMQGSMIGTAGAVVMDRAGAGVSRLFQAAKRGLSNAFRNRSMTRTQRRAVDRLRIAFERDGIDSAAANDAMERLGAGGIDDAGLLDIGGDNVRRLLRGSAQRGGAASELAENFLEQRAEAHATRVGQQLSRFLGGTRNYRQSVQQAVQERAARARPLYDHALGTLDEPVLAPRAEFADIIDRMPRRALRNVRESARITGGRLGSLDGDQVALLDMQALKFGLDDMIETAGRGNNPMSGRQIAELRQLRQDLLDRMPATYRQANEVFAGDSAMISAMHLGRRALRDDTEELAELVGAMSGAERDMFRLGLVRAVREQAGNVGDNHNVVQRLIGNPNKRERLRMAFDSDEQFALFEQSLRAEADRVARARFVASSSGSQTAPRQMDNVSDSPVFNDLIHGRLGSAGQRVVSTVRDAIRGADQRGLDEAIMEIGTQRLSRDGIESVIARVEQQYGAETALALREALARMGSAAAVAASNG